MKDLLFVASILIGMFLVVFTMFATTGMFPSTLEAAYFAALTTGGIAAAALVAVKLLEMIK